MGRVIEINGPLVTIELADVRTGEEVHVGSMNLSGEVIGRNGARALVQVYEPTESLRPGEPVTALGHPLSVELGPGLLGGIFDGVQRPLLEYARQRGTQEVSSDHSGGRSGIRHRRILDAVWPFRALRVRPAKSRSGATTAAVTS